MSSIGIEEELLLVDDDGSLASVSGRTLGRHRARTGDHDGEDVTQELFLPMIETGTDPKTDRGELLDDVRRVRRLALEAADSVGAGLVASGTPVIEPHRRRFTPDERYERIRDEFGQIGRDALVCGMHVHVEVGDDPDLAVAVIDRLRPWLPVLVAISANSPFWNGDDSGHQSFRSQVWRRWPTAGQTEPYGDAAGFEAAVQTLLDVGAGLDRGMLYLDARPAQGLPTVEIRVADVCLDPRDTVTVALVARGLVRAAVDDLRTGRAVPQVRSDLLKAAHWRAGRHGVAGDLVHPATGRLATARETLDATYARIREPLAAAGDDGWVAEAFERLLDDGTGADVQRRAAGSRDDPGLARVVEVLREHTRRSVEP